MENLDMARLSIARTLITLAASSVLALGYVGPAAAVAPYAGPQFAPPQPAGNAIPRAKIDARDFFRPLGAYAEDRHNKLMDGCVHSNDDKAGCQCLAENLPYAFTWFGQDPWQLFVDSQREQTYVGPVAASLVEKDGFRSETEYRSDTWETAAMEHAACGLDRRSLYRALE